MDELWDTARQYGLVRLSTLSDGNYYCCITFSTITNVELVAKSDAQCKTPQTALIDATNKAIEIVNSMAEPLTRLKELANVKSTST